MQVFSGPIRKPTQTTAQQSPLAALPASLLYFIETGEISRLSTGNFFNRKRKTSKSCQHLYKLQQRLYKLRQRLYKYCRRLYKLCQRLYNSRYCFKNMYYLGTI